MALLDDITSALTGNPLVVDLGTVPKGHVRVRTAFLYPDGSNIDIFISTKMEDSKYLFTDFGQSIEMLLDVQVKPWESETRKRYFFDAIRDCGVGGDGGALEYRISDLGAAPDAILRMGRACLRVSDLAFTRRDSPAPCCSWSGGRPRTS